MKHPRYGLTLIVLFLLAACQTATVPEAATPGPPGPQPVAATATSALDPGPAQSAGATPTASSTAVGDATVDLAETAARLDRLAASLNQTDAFSGAFLVATGDHILISTGVGLANRETGVSNTPDTPFLIGSLTKQFTATAIMMLQEEGKLHVVDPACSYLPNCPSAWKEITIHQLLIHSSGIINYTDLAEVRADKDRATTPEAIAALVADKPVADLAEDDGRYSNTNYVLLGIIVQSVSGMPWERFLQERIFRPLGMTTTGYGQPENLAMGYRESGNPADRVDVSLAYAAGGLYSTVNDLYLWFNALRSGELVSAATFATMTTPYAVLQRTSQSFYGYGLGIVTADETTVIGHEGSSDGFSSYQDWYPDDDTVVLILSNREGDIHGLSSLIAGILFGR